VFLEQSQPYGRSPLPLHPNKTDRININRVTAEEPHPTTGTTLFADELDVAHCPAPGDLAALPGDHGFDYDLRSRLDEVNAVGSIVDTALFCSYDVPEYGDGLIGEPFSEAVSVSLQVFVAGEGEYTESQLRRWVDLYLKGEKPPGAPATIEPPVVIDEPNFLIGWDGLTLRGYGRWQGHSVCLIDPCSFEDGSKIVMREEVTSLHAYRGNPYVSAVIARYLAGDDGEYTPGNVVILEEIAEKIAGQLTTSD
jgi:hypothetical protein